MNIYSIPIYGWLIAMRQHDLACKIHHQACLDHKAAIDRGADPKVILSLFTRTFEAADDTWAALHNTEIAFGYTAASIVLLILLAVAIGACIW